MEIDLINRERYDSFGECIYCRAKASDTKLTDEHVVPYSLGGNAYIRDGSCLDCAEETKKIEAVLGRKTYWEMRVQIGEQTRRKKERPATFKFKASINGGELKEYEAPVGEAPIFTPHPVWGIP